MAAGGVKNSKMRNQIPGWAKGLALILAIGTLCFILLRRDRENTAKVESDGVIIARVVVSKFEKMSDLRVYRISGAAQGVGSTPGPANMFPTTYVMKAPFEAGYFIDLSKLSRTKFFWDEKGHAMIVIVPDVRLDSVQVDESRKTVDVTKGWWVSRNAMRIMRQQASAGAQTAAKVEAGNSKWLAAARQNGRTQLTNLFAQPLRIAGIDADVQVRYEGEPGIDDEQMDRSRSIAEIFAER